MRKRLEITTAAALVALAFFALCIVVKLSDIADNTEAISHTLDKLVVRNPMP